MATIILSAIGSALGGPIGGTIGALVGQQIDRAVFGGGGTREGARLKELSVTTSSYGSAIPRVFGRMRVPGTIIWATDLIERKDKQGGGKGKPSTVTYSYTASFAVALASRPLAGVGRIWADGNLLRGAAGDMKAGGQLRFHNGSGGQSADPLLIAAEGAGQCPAYRGCAYAVFEDLQLADFGNRIPALTFEVFSGETSLSLAQICDGVIDNVAAPVVLSGVAGLSCEGPLADTLAQLDPAFPIDCDVSGDVLTIGREAAGAVIPLRDAATATRDDAFGTAQGFARRRLPPPAARPEVLRYYDVDRDYQPGLQRAPGRASPGQPSSTELPVAMAATDARTLAAAMARRAGWARQTLSWRTAELDPAVTPGALVTVPGEPGLWRVHDWEWRENGVELSLARLFSLSQQASAVDADPGRINTPPDAVIGPSVLSAFELPWDGLGAGDTPLLYAAASSPSAGWTGAALFADHGDGQLIALGSSGRSRAVTGTVAVAVPPASPCLVDRITAITVTLAASDLALTACSVSQLANGANRALIGEEIIQFLNVAALGNRQWRISGLLRGRGGTEAAIGGHGAGEPFVLLDGAATALDAALVGDQPQTLIAALGLGDASPVTSPIASRGITRRPLAPVHPRMAMQTDGSLRLRWTRRARGAWTWLDGVDAPLHEQSEAYAVTLGPVDAPLATWNTTSPELVIDAAQLAALPAEASGQPFRARQQGSYALSQPLLLAILA